MQDVPPALPPPIPAPSDVASPPSDAERSRSGLFTRRLVAGTGTDHPHLGDAVQFHYTAWTTAGVMFDSSLARSAPAEVILGRAMPGATEGLQMMVVGEKRRFWLPSSLAFGGQPGHPSGMVVFDVELLGFTRLPPPDAVPRDLTAPANASCTASGVCSIVLRSGAGGGRPGPRARVRATFSSWTADGHPLESTTSTGEPAVLSVHQVMPGLGEVIQMMVVGEKRRLWIPSSPASGGVAQGGTGVVIYDIDLVSIDVP